MVFGNLTSIRTDLRAPESLPRAFVVALESCNNERLLSPALSANASNDDRIKKRVNTRNYPQKGILYISSKLVVLRM
jgi:hypothetical protein